MIMTMIAPNSGETAKAAATEISRYSVLVLDRSGSMSGTPMTVMKQAAIKFCESVLKADGKNYVAVVSYADRASTDMDFTDDLSKLTQKINAMRAYGNTNTTAGLEYADTALSQIEDSYDVVKNIVLLSDGLPCIGKTQNSGPYSRSQYDWYRYANASYTEAKALHAKDYSVYSLGFFHGLTGKHLVFGRKFLNDLQNAGYYEVTDPSELEFVFGEIANSIVKKTGMFSYPSMAGGDAQGTYFYDDNYFTKSAYTYNPSLATMSLCFAMSAFGSSTESDYANKSINARNLLTDLEFEDFAVNDWYTVKPTADSIGVVAANKKIKQNEKEYTLIAVGVRGAGYEKEWASNFTIGATGQHQGFNEAKNNVLSFLNQYVQKNDITGDIKVWVTGFSRAAATANLVAGALDQGYTLKNCTLTRENMYAYCFEPPAGSIEADSNSNTKYWNIFNIVNDNDVVPKVAPAVLGFRRYGINKNISTPATSSNYLKDVAGMKAELAKIIPSEPYVVDQFHMKKISIKFPLKPVIENDNKNNWSQNVFLNEFVTKMTKERFKSRSNYVREYQDAIRGACKIYFGTEDAQWQQFRDGFLDRMKDNVGILILSTMPIARSFVGSTFDLVEGYAVDSLRAAGISDYSASELNDFVTAIVSLVFKFAVSHPNLTTTLIKNIQCVAQAHYPELCLAWMQYHDPHYKAGGDASFSNNGYRIIRINCPVDVQIYDKQDTLVAAIINDEPQEIVNSSILTSFSEDGEKMVILPVDCSYRVVMTGTAAGTVSTSMSEYSLVEGDITRLQSFYDLPVVTGEAYTYIVPEVSEEEREAGMPEGSSLSYQMIDAAGNLILPDEAIRGHEAANAYYFVETAVNEDEGGAVIGGGIYQKGSYASVTAQCADGVELEGWYINGMKVSSDLTYRFRVSSDTCISAKFVLPVKAPVSSLPSGTYGTQQKVVLTAEEGTAIYYTMDGTVPTMESTSYTGPIQIDKNTEVKAIAVRDGKHISEVAEFYYGIRTNCKFKVVNQWDHGFQGEITLENLSDATIKNWGIKFNTEFDLISVWNAKEVTTDQDSSSAIKSHYLVNDTWNQDIATGAAVTIGFVASYEGEIHLPEEVELCGVEQKTEESDYTVTTELISQWENKQQAALYITNISDDSICDWILEFDYAGQIDTFFTADIVAHEGIHYVIVPKSYDLNIPAGETLRLEFQSTSSSGLNIENVTIRKTVLPTE